MRSHLGTDVHLCEEVVRKLSTVPMIALRSRETTSQFSNGQIYRAVNFKSQTPFDPKLETRNVKSETRNRTKGDARGGKGGGQAARAGGPLLLSRNPSQASSALAESLPTLSLSMMNTRGD